MTCRAAARRLIIVALLVLAACSGGEVENNAGSETERAETESGDGGTRPGLTTDAPSAEVADMDDPPVTTTTRAQTTETTQASTPPADPGGPDSDRSERAVPPQPIVPRSGAYTYRRTTTTGKDAKTTTDQNTVERLSGDDRAGRVSLSLQRPEGKVTSRATVSAAGVLVEDSVIQSPLGRIPCNWDPDWRMIGELATENSWTFDTRCSDSSTGMKVDVHIFGSGKVVGSESIRVNGRDVLAWVFETTMTTEFRVSSLTINGTQRAESTSRTWVDPALGMQVRDETDSTSSGDFETGESEDISEFVRFDPA